MTCINKIYFPPMQFKNETDLMMDRLGFVYKALDLLQHTWWKNGHNVYTTTSKAPNGNVTQIRQFHQEGRPIVYLDETWYGTHDVFRRIIILHAGVINVWAQNALLISRHARVVVWIIVFQSITSIFTIHNNKIENLQQQQKKR